MKIRMDFVTNSSSSSFLICKNNLSENQIEAIREHSEMGKRMGMSCADYSWHIEENEMFITGYTSMDNFDMYDFLKTIGITGASWGEYEMQLPQINDTEKIEQMSKQSWEEILEKIKSGEPYDEEDSLKELQDLIDGLED